MSKQWMIKILKII